MTVKEYYLKKYPEDEFKYFVGRVFELLERCSSSYRIIFTDFLDPLQTKVAVDIAKHFGDVKVQPYGGFEEAERSIVAIFPQWDRVKLEDYPLSIIKIENKGWGRELSHRDYLGALLSTGIKREKLGDLLVSDRVCWAAVYSDVVDYVKMNLERVGSNKVEVKGATGPGEVPPVRFKELRSTVASPRLDAVIGTAFGLSRGKAMKYISGEKVKVNWEMCIHPETLLEVGDIVSVRGEGKFKVLEIAGTTKKGRTVIVLNRYT